MLFWSGVCMGWFGDLAHFFLGGHDDGDERLSEEDREAAQAADLLMGSDFEDEWYAGVSMGTIPDTPTEYEGEDTGPHESIPWYRHFLPW